MTKFLITEDNLVPSTIHIGGGVLPYSLGRGVPLGSRKSNPLLDQILQILWPYTRLKMLNCSWFQSFVRDPIKWDPIPDQFSMITRPYTRLMAWKLNSFEWHIQCTHIAKLWEYPPRGQSPHHHVFVCGGTGVIHTYMYPPDIPPTTGITTLLFSSCFKSPGYNLILYQRLNLPENWIRDLQVGPVRELIILAVPASAGRGEKMPHTHVYSTKSPFCSMSWLSFWLMSFSPSQFICM